MSLGALVASCWEQSLRESPDPFRRDNVFNRAFGLRMPTYREQLDEVPVNFYGETIPRIVTVRRNLRMFRNARLNPERLPA